MWGCNFIDNYTKAPLLNNNLFISLRLVLLLLITIFTKSKTLGRFSIFSRQNDKVEQSYIKLSKSRKSLNLTMRKKKLNQITSSSGCWGRTGSSHWAHVSSPLAAAAGESFRWCGRGGPASIHRVLIIKVLICTKKVQLWVS